MITSLWDWYLNCQNLPLNLKFFPSIAEEFLFENFDFSLEKRRTSETDDYAFLDENEDIEDEDVFVSLNR